MESTTMRPGHLPAADRLRQMVGWNQTRADWETLLSLEPKGCFVGVENGEIIGTVTTTTYGDELAWIGMMLVHPDHRRKGVGTHLMRTALDYLRSRRIACIRLDATPAGRPVYEKLGFVAEWTLTRHQALSPAESELAGVRELSESDWPAIDNVDCEAFGVSRARIVRRLARETRATLVCPAQGPIAGYGMLRPGSQSDYVGPVICKGAAAARSLISGLLQMAGSRSVFWDVPDGNAVANQVARGFGFAPVRPLTRMRLGPATVRSDPSAQLAIADPSLG